MKKPISILLLGILAITLGCSKNDPNGNDGGGSSTNNSAPTCSITTPQNGATIAYDENISVSVVAEDSDGTIAKVSLYIDEVGYSEMTAFPYNFTIPSGVMSPGQHTIKAVAKDNGGSNGESSVTITIEEPATESPDFVTFSDGQIPPTWQTATWQVDNTGGYDDIYSLKVVGSGTVMTTKTIQGNGLLEYYVKGDIDYYWSHDQDIYIYPLELYIDGGFSYTCTKQTIGSWEKRTIYLGEGSHTFIWEYTGDYCQIDAIRFTHNCTHRVIGEFYQGGYVGYLDSTQEHGLIVSNDLGNYNWEDANSVCNNYSVGQYSDWRLPTYNEACSIWNQIGDFYLFEILPLNNYCWTSSYCDNDYIGVGYYTISTCWHPHPQAIHYEEVFYINTADPEEVHSTRAVRSF